MRVVAHEGALARVGPDGVAVWERAASRAVPNPDAVQALTAPDFPDALEYLHGWWRELRAGSPEGLTGAAPVTYRDIAAWAALTGTRLTAREVRALLEVDRAFLHALRTEDEAPKPATPDAPARTPWPTKAS